MDLALIMKLQNRIKELEKEIKRLNTEREREEEENKDKEHTVYNSLKVYIFLFFCSCKWKIFYWPFYHYFFSLSYWISYA